MNDVYPFLDKVKELLEAKGERLVWLAAQIDKTDRWFYNIKNIERLEFGVLEQISQIMDFNFIDDYNFWRKQNNQGTLFIAREPDAKYKVERKMTTSFVISSTLANAKENSTKVLVAIDMACEKHGYEFELL